MTIHYHGTPITPRSALLELAGRNFCVSFADSRDMRVCQEIGQSVMIDSGDFSTWTRGLEPDREGYYAFVDQWVGGSTWAVMPDVIEGTERENDDLIAQWPFGHYGAPVWHMHETIERLSYLATRWPRVCLGSSAEYATIGTPRWHERMTRAMNYLCGNGRPPTQLHMLRGMSLSGSHYPFASVDSTDIARNHNRDQNSPRAMAERWDVNQCATSWRRQMEQMDLCG